MERAPTWAGGAMDKFEFFFSFYGLLLGLAAAEILSSLGAYVRSRQLRTIEVRSALLALLTFIVICSTWMEAWWMRDTFQVSFASMLPPIAVATAYYLAAVVVLPKEESAYDDMDVYLAHRKNFVVCMLIVAEVFVLLMFLPVSAEQLRTTPALFWLQTVPLTVAIFGAYLFLLLAGSRRGVITATVLQIAIFIISYWSEGWISDKIKLAYGYV